MLHPYVERLLDTLATIMSKHAEVGGGSAVATGGSSSAGDGEDGAEGEGEQEDSEGLLQQHLFVLLFECLGDAERWADGLKAVNRAFSHVPATLQRPLWQYKVVFLSKLGRSALDGLAKVS